MSDRSDLAAVGAQLGRPARGVHAVAHRCRCGLPDVVETEPRLPDGTPFPTLYYLTCPRLVGAVSTLEASGLMREMTARLETDPAVADAQRGAHESYLRRRRDLGDVPEIDGVSAGGMPTRVKCLHVLVGHALAAGPGVNPLGDEALAAVPDWWAAGPCVKADPDPEQSVRVAAVDCGTNSIKLLVADLDPATGEQTDRVREQRIVRLGAGVDETGLLAAPALRRTFDACESYAATVARHRVGRLAIAATSAARDAGNGAALVTGMQQRLGVKPRVLTGADEAALSYAGAARGLGGAAEGALLLVDVGGGSTELARGSGLDMQAVGSADVGAVRLTERHLVDDPPTDGQVASATADTEAALDELEVSMDGLDAVVLVSGEGLTVAAHVLALDRLDPERLHGAQLRLAEVRASCAALLRAPQTARLAMGFMVPGRADVIGGGALVLGRVLARVMAGSGHDVPVLVSTHDVVDGIAWTLVS